MTSASFLDTILSSIVDELQSDLSRCGFMYHIFGRAKSPGSMNAKIEKKGELYRKEGRRMQDLLGVRITLYFSDDVEILHQFLKSRQNYVDETIDEDDVKTFCPKRLNLIMNVMDPWRKEMEAFLNQTYPEISDILDLTYEIQIRTILSEGWHEVEHDLRYKCQDDWVDFKEESRLLNGIFATLESSEWAMLTLFDKMAYSFYKKKNWTNMIRNKMRLRFHNKSISDDVANLLTEQPDLAKSLFRVRRSKVIRQVLENEFKFPLQYDTVVHLLNRIEVKDPTLAHLENPPLKTELDRIFGLIE